jgi:hypothetical protein
MNNRKNIDPDTGSFNNVLDDSYSDSTAIAVPEFEQTAVTYGGGRSSRQVNRQAEVTLAVEATRATLAQNAVMQVGSLSALAESLAEVAPSSASRNKLVVDTYAYKAAQTIHFWGGR